MDPGQQPAPGAPDGPAGSHQQTTTAAAYPQASEALHASQARGVQTAAAAVATTTTTQQHGMVVVEAVETAADAQPRRPLTDGASCSSSSTAGELSAPPQPVDRPVDSTSSSSPSPSSPPSSSPPSPSSPPPPPSRTREFARRRLSPTRDGTLVLRRSYAATSPWALFHRHHNYALAVPSSLDDLPNEVLLQVLGYLDVNDLLATSRTSHHLRCLCVAPILHTLRLRHIRAALPPLLASPSRPSLDDLIARSIFLTSTTVVSRKLARSLVSIRLSRRLAARPPAHVLVERCVLPPECAPGIGHVAPALAARTRAVEREKLKDGLRRWVGAVWKREVGRRSERIRKFDESAGVGKVWRLRKFWERMGRDA